MNFIEELDDEKNRKSNDKEVDNILDEEPIRNNCWGTFGKETRDSGRKRREFTSTANYRNEWHNDV